MWFVMTNYFPDLINTGGDSPQNPPSSSAISGDDLDSAGTSPDDSGGDSSSSAAQDDKTVPKFVGQKYDAVSADTQYDERFVFERREEFNDNYEAGVIYDQSPMEGSVMQNRGTVILFVSKGKMEAVMPELTNKTLEEAEEEFEKLSEELDYTITFQTAEKYDGAIEAGKIINSVPAAGATFNPKLDQVILYISMEVVVSETKEVESKSSSSSRLPDTEYGERP
jgi:serine/threonine-protein kinase